MELEQSTLQVAYSVSVVTSIGLFLVLWRHRENTGGIPLLCYVFSGLLWGGIQLANVTVHDPAISAALYRILYVNIAFGAAVLFVFALEYTGRERYLGPKTYLALSIHPLYIVLFVVADPGGLFFGPIEADPTMPLGIDPNHGIAFGLHVVYTYLLMTASILMFVDLLYRTRSLYRGQSVALIGGAVLPSIPPLALLFGLVEIDATPIVIPIASALLTVAIVRYQLVDLVPIVRDRVLDHVNDGVFVIDSEDRLVDVNPAGRGMLARIGVDDDSLVGREFPSLLPHEDLRRKYEIESEKREETTVEASIGPNYFQVTATPIDDGRGRHVGWLLIAHDITERKYREKRLERQNERLEQFASLVSHDLRNPLNVAGGYLDLARGTDDNEQYLDKIERAHDRMETIIDDVLALTREGTEVTDPQPVALDSIAERAWAGVDTGDATLEVRSNEHIMADPDRLRRLFENLFRNAIEHGADGSDITVTVGIDSDADGPGRTVYVEDTGSGIPAAERDRIFEDGYSTGDEGTGLGLSIVERIAGAHDWTVTVTEGSAGGARFEFTGVTQGFDQDSVSVDTVE